MANPEWMEIYRRYDPEKLETERLAVEAEKSVYISQGIGQKNYQKSLEEIRGRLSAIARIQNERESSYNQSVGRVNFGNL